jgi:Rrf2 family protein
MRLSKRGEYGLRAMMVLATPAPDGSSPAVQIREIAEREQMPAKFLEQILLALKNAGLLHSKMGVGGGYHLAKPPSEISIGQIVRVLDGPLAPVKCVSQMAYEPCGCPDEETCGLRLVMADVRNAIAKVLDGTSLSDVAAAVNQAHKSKFGPTNRVQPARWKRGDAGAKDPSAALRLVGLSQTAKRVNRTPRG